MAAVWLSATLAQHSCGFAASHYSAAGTRAMNIVLDPYSYKVFCTIFSWDDCKGDLKFLGWLVSQKVCNTLLAILGRQRQQDLYPKLGVICDGSDRSKFRTTCHDLDIAGQVHFLSTRQVLTLAVKINRHLVLMIPSRYEEPFGIPVLEGEGVACSCMPTSSERGKLVDATSGPGLTFPNGDEAALERVQTSVLLAPDATRVHLDSVDRHLAHYSVRNVADLDVSVSRKDTGVR